MTVTTQLTQRDKKLLVGLGAVLVFLGLFLFLVKPALTQVSDLKSQVTAAETQQKEAEQKIAQLSGLQTAVNQGKETLAQQAQTYYGTMESQGVDSLLTGMALSHGFAKTDLRELSITMPTGDLTLAPYISSGLARGQSTASDGQSSQSAPVGATTAQEQAAAAAAQSGQTQPSAQTETAGTSLPGLSAVEATFRLAGSRTQLQSFLDLLCTQPSIRVVHLLWSENDEGTLTQLTLQLQVYMTDDLAS